ncbi:MAG: hypothetical protein IJ325_08085 [Clostridia bacterium]|nr:hypothetical protein [Clostridia bacterium]
MNRFPVNPTMNNTSDEFSFMKGKILMVDRWCFCRYHAIKALSDKLVPYLVANQMHLYLAESAVSDINRQIADPATDPSYRRSLQSGLQIIQVLEDTGLIKYIGSEDESTEETFLKFIMFLRTKREIVVLTQQKWLYDDITLLSSIRTVQVPRIHIRRLNNDGCLENFRDNPQTSPAADSDTRKCENQPVSNALMRLGML